MMIALLRDVLIEIAFLWFVLSLPMMLALVVFEDAIRRREIVTAAPVRPWPRRLAQLAVFIAVPVMAMMFVLWIAEGYFCAEPGLIGCTRQGRLRGLEAWERLLLVGFCAVVSVNGWRVSGKLADWIFEKLAARRQRRMERGP